MQSHVGSIVGGSIGSCRTGKRFGGVCGTGGGGGSGGVGGSGGGTSGSAKSCVGGGDGVLARGGDGVLARGGGTIFPERAPR